MITGRSFKGITGLRRRANGLFVMLALAGVVISFTAYCGLRSFRNPLDTRLVKADNELGFRLFKEILNKDPSKNFAICPAGLALALQLTYNGATGQTKRDMAKALGVGGIPLQEINRANAKLIHMLENPGPGVRVDIANSLSGGKGVRFTPEFTDIGERIYHVRFRMKGTQDIASASGSIEAEPAPNQLVIASRASFEGVWMWEFDQSLADKRRFRYPNGRDKFITMLGAYGPFMYRDPEPGLPEILSMRYTDHRTSMYLMPAGANDPWVDWVCHNLNSGNWEKWISQMRKGNVMVYLPPFEVRCAGSLTGSLRSLGVDLLPRKARTDFENMCLQPFTVAALQYSAYLEVCQEGSRPLPKTTLRYLPDFCADRPFFFAIRDDRTGLILFMGWVADPTEGMESSDQLH